MKSASEQLAKTCGIQPVEIKGHTVYPDFKNPKNFVKLYEMYVHASLFLYGTIARILQQKNYDCSTVTNFLKSLNSFLLDKNIKYRELIKTKIRRSKWE